MSLTEHDFSIAVSDLESSNVTLRTVHLLWKICNQDITSRLVSVLTSIDEASGQNHAQAILRTMQNFERVAEIDSPLACILMSALWSIASDHSIHDVCDSIDLWIHQCNSADLRRHLQKLIMCESDTDKRRHFEQLIESKSL